MPASGSPKPTAQLSNTFLKGLATALPLTLTVWAIYWLFVSSERFLGDLLSPYLGERYVTGMGIVITLCLIYLLGLLMQLWLFRKLMDLLEAVLTRLPLVKTIYSGIRDLMDFVARDPSKKEMDKVVVIRFGEQRILGFMTREDCSDLPDGLAPEGFVAVYLPMSYQLGGYTLYVPRESVEAVDMDMESAMRIALTAGVGSSR